MEDEYVIFIRMKLTIKYKTKILNSDNAYPQGT